MARFNPHYRCGRITIAYYPPEIVQKLRALIGTDQPIGACFDTDGSHGTIHIDPQGLLGTAAPFLVHEMVHALDSTLWRAARVKLTPKQKDKIFLKAEKAAFEFQHYFVEELKALYPSYAAFLASAFPSSRVLTERLTEKDITELYRFQT